MRPPCRTPRPPLATTSIQALFRRGCARLELKEYAQARSDLASASELEPNNKAIKTKIVEAERTQMVDAKKAKGANDYDRFGSIDLDDDEPPAPPPAAATERQPPKAAAAPRSSAATPTSAPKPRPPAPAAQPAAADEPIGTEVKPGGGYRYWSKTPAAPRVIAQPITDPAQIAVAEVKGGASVWNAAGTYEERDQTAWAKGELTARLDALRVDVPGGGSVRCTGSKGFSGDAGIHVVRGKKRFLFDFKFAIPFEVELPESEQSFSGEVNVSDFSEHDQSEWEVRSARVWPGATQPDLRTRTASQQLSASSWHPACISCSARAGNHLLGRQAAARLNAARAVARRRGQEPFDACGRHVLRRSGSKPARIYRHFQGAVTSPGAPHKTI